MDIAALINRLGGGRRKLSGAFFMSAQPIRGNSLRAELELLRSETAVHMEGGFVYPGREVPVPFVLEIPFAAMSPAGGEATLTAAPIGKLTGHLLSSAAGFEYLGKTDGTTCAVHLHFIEQSSFLLSGIIESNSQYLAFSVEPATEWEAQAKARIYSLRARNHE